ncbi:hypothetical protein, partial [Bradyrhizobium japonicum]|uniref:hypothetical protein n=1 Tax=Bradyrhizobium japonicum TaxID=375 RepID=UPI001E4D54AF
FVPLPALTLANAQLSSSAQFGLLTIDSDRRQRGRLAALADFNRELVQFLRKKISCSEPGGPIPAV